MLPNGSATRRCRTELDVLRCRRTIRPRADSLVRGVEQAHPTAHAGVREDQIDPLGGRTVTGDRGDDAADLFEPGQRGSTGVPAPSALAAGRVSTSLQLGPPPTKYYSACAANVGTDECLPHCEMQSLTLQIVLPLRSLNHRQIASGRAANRRDEVLESRIVAILKMAHRV